jgi:AcrR family transcriptional regulator
MPSAIDKILIWIKIMQIEANYKCKADETMARNPDETKFQLQRDRLLKAAAHCFNQKGYSGTSLKDVANQLGLTDAALYYYVRNKEELVYQCYVRAAEIGRDAMDRAIADGNCGFDQVRRYIRYHLEYMLGDRGPIAIMSEIPSLQRNHRDEILEFSRRHSSRFEALLKKGIDDGSVVRCDIRMTGNAIMGSINWIPKWFHGDERTAGRVLQEFPEILSCGLRPVDPFEDL